MRSEFASKPLSIVPFEFLAKTFVVVKVEISGTPRRFILDTGAGFDAISTALCRELNCKTSGTLTGKRMRGDEITLDLTRIDAIAFAGIKKSSWEIGVTNVFDEIPSELGKIDGVLSLKFFSETPFTIDFLGQQIIIESPESLKQRIGHGHAVTAKLYSQLPKTLGIFLSMNAFGEEGSFEVDTGNLITILPQKHLKRLSVDLNAPSTKIIKNETMNRVYSKVNGNVSVSGAPLVHQANPEICFEDVIYDGVIGIDFFKDKIVTFDVPNSKIVFSDILAD